MPKKIHRRPLICVPAFNESKSIRKVLLDLAEHGYTDVVVIDDGSQDDTGKIAQKHAKVLTHLINRGLGAGLGTGFAYARETGRELLVTFDSDGQHRASDIPRLIAPILAGEADVVVGSRLLANWSGIPLTRRVLNYLSNLATFGLYGVSSTDTLSGLRAFNRQAIETIEIKTDRMEVSNEFFREIKRNNLRYQEVSIEPIYTDYSLKNSKQGSYFSAVPKLAFRMVFRLFR